MSRRLSCSIAAVALLLLLLGATAWLYSIAPTVFESYGISTRALQLDWSPGPVVLVILASILVAARTDAIPENRKCYWLMGMVLFFPLSIVVLAVRVIRSRLR